MHPVMHCLRKQGGETMGGCGTDMSQVSCDIILQVPKMPQDVREGLLRTIRFAEVRHRIRALERYKLQQQGMVKHVKCPSRRG